MNTYPQIEPSGESAGTVSLLPLGPDESLGAGLRALRRGLLREVAILEQVGAIARGIGMAEAEADFARHALDLRVWIRRIDSLLLVEGEPAGRA